MRKNRIHTHLSFLPYLYMALLLIGLNGCDKNSSINPMDEETPILLQLQSGNLTESTNPSRELRIDQLAVLVFKQKGNKEVFSYRAKLLTEATHKNDSRYELLVSLRKSIAHEKYTVVIIANYDLPTQMGYMEGIERTTALATMTYSAQADNNTYVWDNANNRPFPMWGETEPKEITNNTNFETIYMLRAVAKIDIGFDTDKNGEFDGLSKNGNPYSLETIYIYRSHNAGVVAPREDVISNPYTEGLKVTSPTLPEKTLTLNPPIRFDVLATTSGVTDLIYLAESNEGKVKDIQKTTSLILGIKHESFKNTMEGQAPNIRYFKADIANKGEINTLPILRNHHYIIGIQELIGEGNETPDIADEGGINSVIAVNVLNWIPKNSELQVEGEQIFNISERQISLPYAKDVVYNFTFSTNLKQEQISITTDETTKESLEIKLDYTNKKISVKTLMENTRGKVNVYSFHIYAGRMKIQIVIKQTSK